MTSEWCVVACVLSLRGGRRGCRGGEVSEQGREGREGKGALIDKTGSNVSATYSL